MQFAMWTRWRAWSPWQRRAALASLVLAPAFASSLVTQRRLHAQYAEGREFETGSANEQLASSLETGDLVLFHRTVWDGRPLRTLCLLLSKYISGEWDHVGVIVRDRESGVPYVLEYSLWSGVQFFAFDRRVLNSQANEIAVRKLVCARTPAQLDRVDALVRYYRGGGGGGDNDVHHSALVTLRLLSRQVWHAVRHGASGGAPSQYVELMGQALLGAQERIENEERVVRLRESLARLQATNADATSAADAAEADALTAKLARIQASLRRAARRDLDVERALHKLVREYPWLSASDASAATSELSPCDIVHSDPSPSAALVAQVLQLLDVLPVHAIDAQSLSSRVHSSPPPAHVPPRDTLVDSRLHASWSPLSAYAIPRTSFYLPKHFLSSSTLPRVVVPRSAVTSTANAAAASASSSPSIDSAEWHRELFIKTKNRALRYQQAF